MACPASDIHNLSNFTDAYHFGPLTDEKIGGSMHDPVLVHTGAEVLPDGSVRFRIFAPNASSVYIQFPQVSNRIFERDCNYDPEACCARGHSGEIFTLTLEKGADGIFEALLPWDDTVSGFRNVNVYLDGTLVLYPHIPVYYTDNRFCNYIEIPEADSPAMELRDVPHGSVTMDYYWSSVMNRYVRQLVYTPPEYRTSGERYPVLYLQEGRSEVETGWVYAGKVPQIMDNLIAGGKAVPAIVVMNDGMLRTPEDEGERYDGFIRMICEDTIPYVEANYRCIADKWHRGFAGLSMGGMQACKGGLEHPELFAWLGWFSCAIRMRDVELNFDNSHHLDCLRDYPEQVEKDYKLIYRANGIGEIVRDRVILDDDQWILDHGVDKLRCYRRDVLRENHGEHEWSTFRLCFYRFAQLMFKE